MFLDEEAAVQVQLLDHNKTVVFSAEELEGLLSSLESDEPITPNSSGLEGSVRAVFTSKDELRKQRRMISNRESARRSRWRKKRHLEKLTEEVNRLKIANKQLKNRLSLVINQCHVAWLQNEQLRSESVALSAKLLDLYWTLAAMQSSHVPLN